MKLPFDRERMRERNLLDDIDEIEQASRMTLAERFVAALGMSEFCIGIARGNPDAPPPDREEELEEKSRLWAAPLRLARS